jgi:transcriptional regulator with XRE-family HTH domain
MTTKENFGRQIREARAQLSLTQEDLETISGVSQTIISKVENEKRSTVTDDTAVRLCATLGICEQEVGTLAQFLHSRGASGVSRDELGMLVALRASRATWRNAPLDAWVLALSAIRQALSSR